MYGLNRVSCAPFANRLINTCVNSLFQFVDTSRAETRFDFADVRPPTGDPSTWSSAVVGVCSTIGASLRSLKMSVALPTSAATFNTIVNSCPSLERIDVFIPNDELATTNFAKLEKLKELHLLGWEAKILSAQSLPASLECLTGLRELKLANTDTFREFLIAHPHLKELEMSNSDEMFEGKPAFPLFHTIADVCHQLERLAVVECGSASIDGIERLANLRELAISTTYHSGTNPLLTDERVAEICSRNPRLSSLRISGRDHLLTVHAYEAIAMLVGLEELELSCYPAGFTYGCFRAILEGVGASLRRLSLLLPYHDMCDLNDASIDAIRVCPKLRVLVVRQAYVASFSVEPFRRLVNAIAEETFELVLCWHKGFERETEYATFVADASFPSGVVVRGLDEYQVKFLAHTIRPP